MFIESILIVRLFYISSVTFLMGFLYNWQRYSIRPNFSSSWPADWIWIVGEQNQNITIIVLVALISNLICAIVPFNLLPRLIAFTSTQIFIAYNLVIKGDSYHSYYGFTLIYLIFLTLPTSVNKMKIRSIKYHTIATMWLSAGALVTIYFLIGIGNIRGGLSQFLKNEVSIFDPISVLYFILDELQSSGRKTILLDYISNTYQVFWLGLFLVLFEKLSGPLFWLKAPRYLPALGYGLIIFHLFNGLAFGLAFAQLALQIGVFLCLNPTRLVTFNSLKKSRVKRLLKIFF